MKPFKPCLAICVAALALSIVLLRRDAAPSRRDEIATSTPELAPASGHGLRGPINHQPPPRHTQNGTQAGTLARPEDNPSLRPWEEALRKALTESDNAPIRSLIENARGEYARSERTALLDDVARSLMTADSSRAALLLRQIVDMRDRHYLAATMTRTLLEKDPQSAAQWAARIPDSTLAQDVHEILAREWARTDLDATLAWLGTLTDDRVQTAAAEGLMWAWAQRDIQEAVAWARQLPESGFRTKLVLKTAKILATQDPARAAAWTAEFSEEQGRREALTYAVHQWFEGDAVAAAKWAAKLENAATRNEALNAVEFSRANRGPGRAAPSLASQPAD